MAWCRQATSHYMSQCWPRSLSPSGVTRPEWIKFMSTSCEIAHRWMLQNTDTFDDKSTFVQVMARCCRASHHYQSHGWSISMSAYVIIRQQWVTIYIYIFKVSSSLKWWGSHYNHYDCLISPFLPVLNYGSNISDEDHFKFIPTIFVWQYSEKDNLTWPCSLVRPVIKLTL